MTLTPLQENGGRTSGSSCPDAEALATYIDGRASAAERAEIEAHLASCEDCYFVFSETVHEREAHDDRKKSDVARWLGRWSPQLAAGLAAAAAIVVAVEVFRPSSRTQPGTTVQVALNELDAVAGPYRKYDARLTVTPTHRELEPALRSAEPSGALAQREAAQKALREAVEKVEAATRARGTGVEGPRALAAGYFALGRPQLAVDVLEPVAQSSDAGLLSDVAAAHLARRADGDVQRALDLLERAVTLDPTRAEAWFNLGLAAEAARQSGRSQAAWTRYLALDPSSEWATEARWHLEKLRGNVLSTGRSR
jgi:tetratricopeptide (TPR) repeat protein